MGARTSALWLVGAALATTLGCAEVRSAAAVTGEKIQAAGARTSDAGLKLAIKAKWADDPDVKSKLIQIDVKDGVVTLKGSQPTFEGRRHAEDLARSVEGVVRVDSSLTVE
ncbi:MAG TPA: BON domain-containing protein [Minicystis sp.]|nr:BON domain-containing protein [Minicystis sp.]